MTVTPANDESSELDRARREIEKLKKINAALMSRVERSTELQGNAFSLFETAISLEDKVRHRTHELEDALARLAISHAAAREAKELAEAAGRRLNDAVESINEGFALFDADDRLVMCNQTYLGFWPEVADRIRPGMQFADIIRLISDDGRALTQIIAPDRWVSERMRRHRVADNAHVQSLADGRWIQINELRTSEGGIVGIYTDITDIKAESVRERTREYAQRAGILQATLDAMPEGAALFDQDRQLVAWNGALLTLLKIDPLSMGELITDHSSLVSFVGATTPGLSLGWRDQASRSHRQEYKLENSQTFEVRRVPLPNAGMVLSIADVTQVRRNAATLERRVAERTAAMLEAKTAAEQANLSKTRFLAAASHDLLQPLNAARLFVSALHDRKVDPDTGRLIEQTESALNSVEDLLEALLEISKLDAGAITPEVTVVPLADLFGAMRAEFAPLAAKSGLTLDVEMSNLRVLSDSRLLRRVIQNFLSNAVRYTDQGSVTLRAVDDGSKVVISVSDTGSGIAPENHALIFEEFRRFDGGRSRGMGLGLAIVQRAIGMLGHPLRLDSSLGRGSRFEIELPLYHGPQAAESEVALLATGSSIARRVLVIDNDETILSGMSALLEGWDCEIAATQCGDEAEAELAAMAVPPDLIIADYHLDNDELGDAVVARLWKRAALSIPAIIITADRGQELRDELQAKGLRILHKPIKPAQLRALMTRLTAG
ncbi:NahK/ErcS family hybrid sensor histidine kinase/response regulator [Sphingomonas kaistensis]|uniref:histidine kinase n=1 Tax=Sphingomonas kaistensis TaxID=298708 RepID=A0ABZ2G3C0_9SPHN